MTGIANKRRIRHRVDWDVVAIYLLSASIFATLVSIFGPTIYIVEHHHENSMDVREPKPAASVDVDDLSHEELFKKTIKSCLPSENPKCKEFVPEPIKSTRKVQRVAFLAPPGDVSDSLLKRVELIVREHNKQAAVTSSSNVDDLAIDLISTSHVPPYGYGKTHGYTKMIRLLPEPLLLEVTDALTSTLLPGESPKLLTLSDVKAALRMILRFHCRLSHVAAHTAILTIPLMELLSDMSGTMLRLQKFLASKDNNNDNSTIGENGEEEEEVLMEFSLDDDQAGLMDAELAYGSQILTLVQAELTSIAEGNATATDVMSVLDNVLEDEMVLTKDMSVWPCPSFWTAASDYQKDDQTVIPLSKTLQRLARALSPDCNDRYNTCFVERDKCEFAGDALCQK
jgi:hypothetical protein